MTRSPASTPSPGRRNIRPHLHAVTYAALLSLCLAASALARANPKGLGRALQAPDDPAFEPVLREIEANLPVYESITDAALRVPSQTIDLGPSAKIYRCWKLKLTGDNGKQARDVLQRLKSVQNTLKDLRKKLDRSLDLYLSGTKSDKKLRDRITAQHRSMTNLLERYRSLIEIGKRNGLIKISTRGLLIGRTSVSPRLRSEDYTMVYDPTVAGCPQRENKKGL